jgi:hemerythrin-like domain-containing protein
MEFASSAKPLHPHQEITMPRKNHGRVHSTNAIELLTDDHQEVLSLFEDFRSLREDEDADDDVKQTLVERICTELTIHSEIEEELLYPALRDAFDDHSQLDEAEVEHAIAEQLIAELESMEPGDDLYDAKVIVLGEYVRHHIDEEQEKLFPKAKKAKVDLDTLGEELALRKEELRTEFGMPDQGDDAIEEDE